MQRALSRAVVAFGNLQRRLVAALYGIIGPRAAYRISGWGAWAVYRLLDSFRLRCEAQCRAALGSEYDDAEIRRIAEQAFIHRARNLTDLLLARRYLNQRSFAHAGGAIPAGDLARLRAAQAAGRPVILVSGYYGPFDLLPVFLGFNGIRAGVVYRPHGNAEWDDLRRRVREKSGCEMIPLGAAAERLAARLAAGGIVAILADHHVERGVAVTFLGLPTRASKAVALLAQRYEADVIVAGIRRLGAEFRFELCVADVIRPADWAFAEDATAYVTQRYTRGIETLVRRDPTQYLWGYARWGEGVARDLERCGDEADAASRRT